MPRNAAIQKLSLPELATRINILVGDCDEAIATAQAAQHAALQTAKEIGLLLNQAKALIPHGGWEQWRKENLRRATGKEVSSRMARIYQQVADNWDEIEASGVSSVQAAILMLRKPREKDPEKVISSLIDRHGSTAFASAATQWLRGQGYHVIEPVQIAKHEYLMGE